MKTFRRVNIGYRLRRLRESAGETKKSLASKAGITRPTIQKIESNGNTTIDTLERLIRACGSNFAEFFESRIPTEYDSPDHQELHEKLQQFLEQADEIELRAITFLIEAAFEKFL